MINLLQSPLRLAALARLLEGPANNAELIESTGANKCSVSHTLAMMREDGLMAIGAVL